MADEGGADLEVAEAAGEQRTWLRDALIVLGIGTVFVLVVAAGLRALPGSSASDATDLELAAGITEIDLGDLAGQEVLAGNTRSELLPLVVHGDEPGETSISIVDAKGNRIIDAGPIPVDGWATNAFPLASDRFVAVLVNVCITEPVEGDAGEECGGGSSIGGSVPVDLAVYDIEAGTWDSLRLDQETAAIVGLADVDGTTATFEEYQSRDDEPALWAKVDLTKPLAIGEFTEEGAPRPNGLVGSHGHYDGWGWKASGSNGWEADTTWTGTVDGDPVTRKISNAGDRRFDGTGSCLLISSMRGSHLERLHRLCTS